MKTKNLTYMTHPHSSKGFSIIEFLVASILSMIVLMAITSSYFTARKLNSSANSRLSVQQDLRTAANMIVRDARMAGSFGCFDMNGKKISSIIKDSEIGGLSLKTADQTALMPIKEIDSKDLSIAGFTATSNAIAFQYGSDSIGYDAQNVVISTCSVISKPGIDIPNVSAAAKALRVSSSQNGSISMMRHVVNAYVVGKLNNDTSGLFRIQLDDQGNWGNPQLLAKNITGMDINYFYVTPNSCPEVATGKGTDETFDYQSDLTTGDDATTPASIRIRLNGNNTNNQSYDINATIRGGNTCANRTL